MIYSQSESMISYEMKMANGEGISRDFFENLIEINTFYDNGWYLFNQLEYSVPPLLGQNSNNIDDIFNIFYAQYSGDRYDLTVGNLYLLQGMGLSLHTFQNQDIDFDNSVNGIDINYQLNDKIDIFSSIGYANVKSRINPADIAPSISIKNNLGVIGTKLFYDNFELHYLTMAYNQLYDTNDLISLMNLSNDLGSYLNGLSDYILNENPDYEMNNLEHNIGLSFIIGGVDLYLEKSLVYYNKLLSERTDGYKDYMSIYFNLLGCDILYEYKDYSTTMLYNIFSNPPVVFREPSSSLIGRNLHTIDFSSEYGHQIEINRIFDNDLSFVASYAFALHHKNGYDDVNIFDLDIYEDFSLLKDLSPYEQYFIEFSNWTKNGKLYYRVGYDYYYESTYEKTIEAKTIPMQYAYKFKDGNSLTVYAEAQNKYEELVDKEYDLIYLSPSYNHFGDWSLTFFADIEKGGENVYAMDYTVNFKNSDSQLSLFFGSQKGGLICANGSCIQQPDFEDGLKITLRTNF